MVINKSDSKNFNNRMSRKNINILTELQNENKLDDIDLSHIMMAEFSQNDEINKLKEYIAVLEGQINKNIVVINTGEYRDEIDAKDQEINTIQNQL
jgi:hypothetical protein